ncbi:phosphatase PAP2 family protein [Roseivirga sp. UBA1976]|uniref:phosphatase PAP2 family protein n=1 Tax=Roseivirga sp. UBA1976 TaxID=1947386 RepID=UPI00257C4C78|nr:phosphatase PAP2 family protein [Roseivirga sp. UBA1976]|tara:strand:- start:794 stop:1435 length:642 start_codon:yes stop_codon:yes gene_type:complete
MKADLFGKPVHWLTALYFVVGGILLVSTSHGDLVLWLNDRHSPLADSFFKYWTYVGDGFLLGLVALYFLFTHYHRFYTFLIAIVFQTLFVHVFKQWLYAGEPRPKLFFQDELDRLNFVEGVTVRSYDAFPSGHTASAFTLAFFLMLVVRSNALRIALFISAILVGISRMYILQHFARDVYFGSIFGILSVVIAYAIMAPKSTLPKLQRGLLRR